MRLNYYRFPEETPEAILLEHGCEIILKDGSVVISDHIPDDKRPLVDYIENCIGGLSVSRVKQMIRQYGGTGWTEHLERDGGCFEVTEIKLSGNNSRFKYNHHL